MTERSETQRTYGLAAPVLLTLIAPASLGENIADLLLEAPELASGFTSSAASGHGAGLRFEAASERVRGRGRRTRFELALVLSDADALLGRLQASLGEANVYYWICPIVEWGNLSDRAPAEAKP